jgi:hypothetical protein
MTNPLQFTSPQINPQVVSGGGAPDPYAQLLQAILSGAELGQRGVEERGRESRSSTELALRAKEIDFRIAQQKTEQANAKLQGEALKQLLPVFLQMGGGAQLMGQGGQGSPQPMGGPNPGQAPMGVTPTAAPQQDPMQAFSSAVQNLPPEAVQGFVQSAGPMAQNAQRKRDQQAALAEAERLTRGLLTPEQRDQMSVARLLAEAGAPDEIVQSMLPKAQIDLAQAQEEIRGMRDHRAAARLATDKLVSLGLVAPPSGVTEYVVDNAPTLLANYVADVRRDARAAARERASADQTAAKGALEGTALEIAAMNPDWTPAQIKGALRATPAYRGFADGVLAKAALEAPKNARSLTAPKNETEARIRVVYGPARAALATVNAMDAKGQSLGTLARLAQIDELQVGAGGAAAGGALGALGGPIGAGVGALAGGSAGALLAGPIRAAGRGAMSADQQRLWTAAQSLAAAIYRPETGAQAKDSEIRQTIERYIPLNTDKRPTRELKRVLRRELDATLSNLSGLPSQLSSPIINRLLSEQEQRLLKAGVELTGTGGGGSEF